MQKKLFISLGLIVLLGMTTAQVMAHSTIYTDDLGRLHFLGKDPGAKTLQKVEDYDNPATKDVTNATYNKNTKNVNETKVNSKKAKVTATAEADRANEDWSRKRFWQIW